MPITTGETWKAWFKKKKDEADKAVAEEKARQDKYATELSEWNQARGREQGRWQEIQNYRLAEPTRRATALAQHNEGNRLRRVAEENRRKNTGPWPGSRPGWWDYTVGMVLQDLNDPRQSWKYNKGIPYQMKQWAMPIWNQPWPADLPFDYTADMPGLPGVRGQMAAYQPPAPQFRTADPNARPQDLRGEITQKYGKDFLEKWGRDILGASSGMTPLQEMMGLADEAYQLGDLPTGTQASRDYFAKQLMQYLSGDPTSMQYGEAIGETPSLQKFIKDRLGIQYSGYDDLYKTLQQNYGHVNL